MLPMKRKKKKKNSRELQCVLFADDVPSKPRRESRDPPALSSASSARSWQRCGESFINTPLVKNPQTSVTRPSLAGRTLAQCMSAVSASSSDEAVHITWSSSEGEEFDSAESSLSCKRLLLSSMTNREDLPHIDTDSEEEEYGADAVKEEEEDDDEDNLRAQISDCESEDELKPEDMTSQLSDVKDVEISGYGSDGDDDGVSLNTSRLDSQSFPLQPGEGGRPSVSSWMKSAQAMLQTPQKKPERQIRTPEDSAKKRRKFQSGGLAERLSRLHSRQRSAISFWRHQSDSSSSSVSSALSAADRPGMLLLQVLEVHHECSLQFALCERLRLQPVEDELPPDPSAYEDCEHIWVLLSRETSTRLLPAPGDTLRIYPPWQSLCVQDFNSPIILNTHFIQKVSSSSDLGPVERHLARRYPPYALCDTFGRLQASENTNEEDNTQQASSSHGRLGETFHRHCVSLLEAIESLGQAGSVDQDVEVVVQRVYCVSLDPVDSCSAASVLRSKARSGPSTAPPPAETIGTRLCALVQDDFGTFSVVQLHILSGSEDLHQYCLLWQGKSCTLRGIKVLQRLTRERSCRLFSLIDSLWPPLMSLRSHGDSLGSSTSLCSAPSFCYLLSGQQSSVQLLEGQTTSPLYRHPEEQNLRDLLQGDGKTPRCCSFVATVLYTRMKRSEVGRVEAWLVLTDSSLQEDHSDAPTRRTLPLCIKPSCVVTSSIVAALNSTAVHRMAFRDAFTEHGLLLCTEQSVVHLCASDSEATALPLPVRLDPLSPQASPCSLCTVKGVVVGVDESTAFSWSVCSHCGSEDLKTSTETLQTFHCVTCQSSMDEPQTKIQLEVFLRCPSLTDCMVKVKLQQTTILSVLSDAAVNSPEFSGLDMDSVLGKELGPLPVFVRTLSRTPSLWIGLDEVTSL